MQDVYANFAENYMAMPVIKGVKSESERFAGALDTYTIEAMMQDAKEHNVYFTISLAAGPNEGGAGNTVPGTV